MILVSGGTGTIGKDVLKGLSAAGAKVRALVRDPAKAAELKLPGIELVKGDFADPASLDAAMAGADRAFLLINASPEMVKLQHHFIEAATKAKVKHVVKLSVPMAGPDAPTNLGKWHGETEAELKKSGLAWTLLQPQFFMQNTMMFADGIKGQNAIYAPVKADSKFSAIDARDIAATAVRTLLDAGHEGQTYYLTGPNGISFADIAKTLGEVSGRKINFVSVPADQAKKSMTGMGMPEWFADDMLKLYGWFDSGTAGATSDAVQKVAKAAPRTFAQFAQDFAGVFK